MTLKGHDRRYNGETYYRHKIFPHDGDIYLFSLITTIKQPRGTMSVVTCGLETLLCFNLRSVFSQQNTLNSEDLFERLR